MGCPYGYENGVDGCTGLAKATASPLPCRFRGLLAAELLLTWVEGIYEGQTDLALDMTGNPNVHLGYSLKGVKCQSGAPDAVRPTVIADFALRPVSTRIDGYHQSRIHRKNPLKIPIDHGNPRILPQAMSNEIVSNKGISAGADGAFDRSMTLNAKGHSSGDVRG